MERLNKCLIGAKTIDGVKHSYYFTGKREKTIVVDKAGDLIRVWGEPAANGKIDFKVKAILEEHFNKKIEWEEPPKEYPQEIEIGQSYMVKKEGMQTVVKQLNPEFTIQMIFSGNWGEKKEVSRFNGMQKEYKYKTVRGEDVVEDIWNELTPQEQQSLILVDLVKNHKTLEDKIDSGRVRLPFLLALVQLDNYYVDHFEWKPIYVKAVSRELKNVDFTAKLAGENVTKEIRITSGSLQTTCGEKKGLTREYFHYTFTFDILPFVCDWLGIPFKEPKCGNEVNRPRKHLIRRK